MTLSRSAVLALSALVASTASSASAMPGLSLWDLNNRTKTATSGIHPLVATQIISFCGVDLVGGDIWSARHPNPDACVANCLAETGCDAATWTKYNGGTCWFKQLRGSWVNTVPSVGSASFLRVPVNAHVPGPNFPIRGVDMPGNNIDVRTVDSPLECTIVCKNNPFCFAYTWTNYQGGSCYLKSKASPYVSAAVCTSEYSGRVTNPDTCLV